MNGDTDDAIKVRAATLLRRWPWCVLCILGLCLATASCDDDRFTVPDDPLQWQPVRLPDGVIENIKTIYSDTVRSAAERRVYYADLFPMADHPTLPEFEFHYWESVGDTVRPVVWGLEEELEAHQALFAAQDAGDIFSLELDFESGAPQPLMDPQPGQEEWKSIVITDVDLRVLFDPGNGYAVGDAQADSLVFAPDSGEWFYIVEWHGLGRPSGWGNFKAQWLELANSEPHRSRR